jgi:hypothetical protein
MPLTHELLENKKIPVISARENYENLYPCDPSKWKQEAFLELKNNKEIKINEYAITNIIVIGDS